MILFPFQIAAAKEIADKYTKYMQEPLMITRNSTVPFYQNLNSITGSGKTLILADAITQIRNSLSIEPIVLWLSKGRVVVLQTYNNLSIGKYAELIPEFTVKSLTECKPADIESSRGLLLVATVGKFNQRDKEAGDRKIFQLALDVDNKSLWDMLKERRNAQRERRPFIIIYDEGHNLSDQQTRLLLELEPDALIASSATMRVPTELTNTINRLRIDKHWQDKDFVTDVKSNDVVQSGLVKQHILLGGYVTPMEIAIDDMLDSLKRAEDAAEQLSLPFRPKAIYVSNTNVISSNGGVENAQIRFEHRQARPILIWRHLVSKGVLPEKIAVYCNLKFDSKYPAPSNFNLFAGGDTDYDNFIAGDFQHIIFNLTLQEGWDDPACYFAYIDKDMGSKEQITQIIGRVLRQPGATHYPNPILNTAHFHIRTDEKSVFDAVLQEVTAKITAESPEINLTVYTGNKGSSQRVSLQPKKKQNLPEISPESNYAKKAIKEIVDDIGDYRNDAINTVGKGNRIQILKTIGSEGTQHDDWVEVDHSNLVTARWIFVRELHSRFPKLPNLCDTDIKKFDARIEYNSIAARLIREAAQKVIAAYIEHSKVTYSYVNPVEVPALLVNPEKSTNFSNALHDAYSDLNNFEREFAIELDKTKLVWFRNPSRGLLEIPLLTISGTRNFNPDFVVWADKKAIVAIDTKGEHLIKNDADRKLFHVEKIGDGPDFYIRLVTHGKWDDKFTQLNTIGYSVWVLKNGKPSPIYVKDLGEAIQVCLRP